MMMKRLEALAKAFLASGALGLLLTFLNWNIYCTHLPTSPERVYRLAQHGMVVYQTRAEHLVYWGVCDTSVILCLIAGFMVVATDERAFGKKLKGR
jgi:hypothetical protein